MPRLSISLLGTPHIAINGVPVKVSTHRAIPLMSYLAITGVSQSCEALASLLWSDGSLSNALASLRTTLWRLKSTGLQEWLTLDHNEISLNVQKALEVYVMAFTVKLKNCS